MLAKIVSGFHHHGGLTFFISLRTHRVLNVDINGFFGVRLVVTWSWQRPIVRLVVVLHWANNFVESLSTDAKCSLALWTWAV